MREIKRGRYGETERKREIDMEEQRKRKTEIDDRERKARGKTLQLEIMPSK